ncbi:hypothetical protein [Bradyrhizobium sp. SZCCHNPS1003]|uniref:hypothetical protein n=1 Tax=Bradyrhizobium sp. SZCCHNPS1003 TaxID=3057330 RepID=UPI0028EEE752|nr:hypothetical protein [Bradyrhizobium sp. SZCCHNPS1003]
MNAYAALPGIERWMPPAGFQPIEALRLVQMGWPLAILGENDGLKRILRKSNSGKIDASDWSVIHAGALLKKLGAHVEFPKEGEARTPDIRAYWSGVPVDAEVKTAMVKERQTELRHIMETLTQVIGTRSAPWHPLIHLGEVPFADVQSEVIDSVLQLNAGNRAGVPRAWDVYAVPIDQEEALVDPERLRTLRPAWWEDDGPGLVSTGLSFSANPRDVRRILIAGKLQFVSYLNQVRDKAERPQGNPNHSFLVVLDQGSGEAMPMRHHRWQSELAPWLSLWPPVSGVLCFDQRPYAFGRFCWKLSFHPNPHADRPLPAALLSLSPHDSEICVRPFA